MLLINRMARSIYLGLSTSYCLPMISSSMDSQVAHVRQLGVPHLVVAFDAKVEEACRKYSILYHRDDEGTAEGCGPP